LSLWLGQPGLWNSYLHSHVAGMKACAIIPNY
jgi:hypothetical protein